MGRRAYNFNAGPAALPLEVLEQAQAELMEYKGIGMSIMEVSHRSSEYEHVHTQTQTLIRQLMKVPDNYKILFLQGGASTQFAMIPMNLLQDGQLGSYVIGGSWAQKAADEAEQCGRLHVAAKLDTYNQIPQLDALQLTEHTAYVHVTSNETIEGLQMQQFPAVDVPLIADMSSDIMSRPLDVSQFGMIYAGAQKNLGPSGVTVVIIREDLLSNIPQTVPTMLRYDTHANSNSLYNTPPVYSIYMMNLVLQWVQAQGGLAAVAQKNKEKTDLIYDVIDDSHGFYRGTVAKESRSVMNITFRLPTETLESAFLAEAQQAGFIGLKGHRSVGGLRASTYNAVPKGSCQALREFMLQFQTRHA